MFYKSRKNFFLNSIFSLSLALVFVMASFLFFADLASARPFNEGTKVNQNFTGWAWSENYGWISFNSDTCDPDGDLTDNGGTCPSGAVADYGVDVLYRTGSTTGYAWSENIGWISFQASAGADVKFNRSDNTFSGTAKVYSLAAGLGDIEFRNIAAGPVFGVATVNDQTSPDYGKLSGWAWNGNGPAAAVAGVGMGWISFNSADAGAGGNAYNVYVNLNHTPTAGSYELLRTSPDPDEKVVPAGLGVISMGDEGTFSATWADDDVNDRARMIVCKNNALVSVTGITGTTNANVAGIDTLTCPGATPAARAANTWCLSASTATQGQLSCPRIMSTTTDMIGANSFYTTVCDQFGYCTSPARTDFTLNDQPAASLATSTAATGYKIPAGLPVVTAPPLTADDPEGLRIDHLLDFSARWSDTNTGGLMKMFVCRTSNVIRTHDDNVMGCEAGQEYCRATTSPTVGASGNIGCRGGIRDADVTNLGNEPFYVWMCDGHGACSPTYATNQFFINRRPTVATGMSAPNWNPTNAALNSDQESDLRAILKWNIDDTQDSNRTNLTNAFLHVFETGDSGRTGFDFNEANSTYNFASTSPYNRRACSVANGCAVHISDRGNPNQLTDILAWGTSYEWEAAVRDAYAWSERKRFDTGNGATLTDDIGGFGDGLNRRINGNGATARYTFTTYKHNFPIINQNDVEYFPRVPSANEEVRATAKGYCYEDNVPSEAQSGAAIVSAARPCNETAALSCTYDWQTIANIAELKISTTPLTWGTRVPYTNPSNNPVIMRFKSESKDASGNLIAPNYTLTAIDRDSYFDTNANTQVGYVNEQLPSWREVR